MSNNKLHLVLNMLFSIQFEMLLLDYYNQQKQQLTQLYAEQEARAIVGQVLETQLQLPFSRMFFEPRMLNSNEVQQLDIFFSELLKGKPLQYLIGATEFMDLQFRVTPSVLIPRPETEELVAWMLEVLPPQQTLLDIGTGSGCIAISLSKYLKNSSVVAWDVSPEALNVATENNTLNATSVSFREVDMLNEHCLPSDCTWDVIVSNPPYIRDSESVLMHENVLAHEPHLALFVSDHEPLLFYKSIGTYAFNSLTDGGSLFFEINEAFGDSTITMLQGIGYTTTELRKDLQGKDRMIRAIK